MARALERDGLNAAALHGDKSQDERLKALDAFKKGEVELLICTDVAARGLDIKDVPAVFNLDIPFNAEDYVHRIGRTGRAGASGIAISFVSAKDARLLADVEKLIGKKAEVEPIELEADRRRFGGSPGRQNDGQRVWHDPQARSELRGERPQRPARAPRAPADPFFDRPYEPKLAPDARPEWEGKAQPAAVRGVSPYIKSRKKVAALFLAPAPAPAESGAEPAA